MPWQFISTNISGEESSIFPEETANQISHEDQPFSIPERTFGKERDEPQELFYQKGEKFIWFQAKFMDIQSV